MLTLASRFSFEAEIKRSRFCAVASRADDRAAALAFLEEVRDTRADHNGFALRIGADYRFGDDGEVSGTAGQPILRAIDGQGLDHAVVVVARHYGGIKLGAGGLARAYGGTASECLRRAARVEVRPRVRLRIEARFELVGAIYALAALKDAPDREERFTADGLVLEVSVDADAAERLSTTVREATGGRAATTVVGPPRW